MTHVLLIVMMPCRDNVPVYVLEWMRDNLREYAQGEFHDAYDPEVVHPPYSEGPLVDGGMCDALYVATPTTSGVGES